MNPIRERMPLSYFDQEEEGDDSGDDTPDDVDLLHREESLRSKITPDSTLGWAVLGGFAIAGSGIAVWVRPLVPPWLTSLPSLFAALIPVALLVGLAIGRQSGIQFWKQFVDVKIYTGETVVERVGKLEDSPDKDPRIKVLTGIGWGGLRPTYERIDDRFKRTNALMGKINRKNTDGSWEPALGKLDHVYQADGESSVFDDVVVAHCSGIEETPTAPGFEWTTRPPDLVDMDAARKLVKRDEILREQVIPHLQEQRETSEERVEQLKKMGMDDPFIKLEELPELLEAVSKATRARRTSASTDAVERVDDDVEETMEAKSDA